MDKLKEIFAAYDIEIENEDGTARSFYEIFDDIYIKLNPLDLLMIMDEIEENSDEIFGGHTNAN